MAVSKIHIIFGALWREIPAQYTCCVGSASE